MKPKLIIFASGTKDGGGSGFKNLVLSSRGKNPTLHADIVAVVSNIRGGGVEQKAAELKVPFVHFPKAERSAEAHEALVSKLGGKKGFVALSGCLWLVPMKRTPSWSGAGLDPRRVFNIHPGPLPGFGGDGMHGMHVHEAVIRAYKNRMDRENLSWLTESAVTMHFVTSEYDKGPVFFQLPVPILPTDTAETLAAEVNRLEHRYQPWITNLVVSGQIFWNGADASSLVVPVDYKHKPKN